VRGAGGGVPDTRPRTSSSRWTPDTLLDEQAIENGLQPFAKPKVMSVAGMLIGLNRRHSLLTRLVDLAGHTDSTLNTRACHSWRRRRHQHAEAKGAAELVGGVDPVT
jgi:hypothetical protein